MRFSTVCVGLMMVAIVALTVGGMALSARWWNEAPMTADRYAALCGNQPQCYPAIEYFLDLIMVVGMAIAAPLGLVVGVVLDRRARRAASVRPPVNPYRGPPLI
jgi:hypothetical protein